MRAANSITCGMVWSRHIGLVFRARLHPDNIVFHLINHHNGGDTIFAFLADRLFLAVIPAALLGSQLSVQTFQLLAVGGLAVAATFSYTGLAISVVVVDY